MVWGGSLHLERGVGYSFVSDVELSLFLVCMVTWWPS